MIALKELGFDREIRFFNSAETALDFLYSAPELPFMIVSDINMPKMDGVTFKRKIDACEVLKSKSIPFIFLSTSTNFVQQISNLNIQGYFEKGSSWEQLRETMKTIFRYWQETKHVSMN